MMEPFGIHKPFKVKSSSSFECRDQLQVIESLQDQCVDGATGPPADRMQALNHIVFFVSDILHGA